MKGKPGFLCLYPVVHLIQELDPDCERGSLERVLNKHATSLEVVQVPTAWKDCVAPYLTRRQ